MNVLLIFADQMRGQAMGCAGNKQVHTPNMDRLTGEGALCRQAFANCPVCTPSRGTLLTGLHPLKHGAVVNDVPIKTDVPSLGTIFRDAGYVTGYIGKWHLDGCPRGKFTPPGPGRLGFDYWAVHNCNHNYWDAFYYSDSEEPVKFQGYEPDHQTELACKFIEENRKKDWCLTLSWAPPHDPYDTAPEAFKKMFDPARIKLRPNVPEEEAATAREKLAGYYAHIAALDACLGRILDKLDEQKNGDDTLVIFTSDHGDMLHSQGLLNKQLPYDESIRIPLIFRKRGLISAEHKSDEIISIVDLLPTILGLANVSTELVPRMEGQDLSDMVRGAGGPGASDALLMDICSVDQGLQRGHLEWRGLRTKKYTYARTLQGPWVLFDNETDPCQTHNLAQDPNYESARKNLERRMIARLQQAGDPFAAWQDVIRSNNLVDLWNIRERELHGDNGRFLEP